MSTTVELCRVKAELAALRAEIESLLADLRRYADKDDLSDPNNPRHVSVGLMGIRLRSMLDADA